jgi:hypothetical protein
MKKNVVLCLAAALLALLGVGMAFAAGIYPASSTGYDVSYPQCGEAYPALPFAFGIVGVTSGRAFSQNSCLAGEYAWATKQGTIAAALYMNLNYPVGTTASEGMSGPAGNCSRADKTCQAYNYGWNAAQAAYSYALSQGAVSLNWWLDIETANSWSAKTALNQQVIQGAIDFLRGQGVTAGIYSTKSMWNKIAGSFAPGLPNWVAGASSLATAPNFCAPSYSFGGGRVWLVQYPSGAYSADYACP